jgi:hypothetical protein
VDDSTQLLVRCGCPQITCDSTRGNSNLFCAIQKVVIVIINIASAIDPGQKLSNCSFEGDAKAPVSKMPTACIFRLAIGFDDALR